MSWFKLNESIGTNYRIDPNDLKNTKRALNQLGYYDIPPHRGIDDWTDEPMFEGIRRFQKDNGLKIDAFMRPGGPTERAMIEGLAKRAKATDEPVKETPQTTPPRGSGGLPQTPFLDNPAQWYIDKINNRQMENRRKWERERDERKLPIDGDGPRG